MWVSCLIFGGRSLEDFWRESRLECAHATRSTLPRKLVPGVMTCVAYVDQGRIESFVSVSLKQKNIHPRTSLPSLSQQRCGQCVCVCTRAVHVCHACMHAVRVCTSASDTRGFSRRIAAPSSARLMSPEQHTAKVNTHTAKVNTHHQLPAPPGGCRQRAVGVARGQRLRL